MRANQRHFPDRHYEGTPSGPFALLNPTVRRFPLSAISKPDADSKVTRPEEAQIEPEQPTAAKDEVRAEDVQRQWRSRDNRKGEYSSGPMYCNDTVQNVQLLITA